MVLGLPVVLGLPASECVCIAGGGQGMVLGVVAYLGYIPDTDEFKADRVVEAIQARAGGTLEGERADEGGGGDLRGRQGGDLRGRQGRRGEERREGGGGGVAGEKGGHYQVIIQHI